MSRGAMCSVCHHRADKHWKEPSGHVAFCHHPRGGEFCGRVGVHAAADGDAKKGGEKRRREKRP